MDVFPVAVIGFLELLWLFQNLRLLVSQSGPVWLFLLQTMHRLATVAFVLHLVTGRVAS